MRRMIDRAGWAVAAALALALIATAAGSVRGGPLDPPGAPAPSGKTLEEIPGSWSRALAANDGAPGPDPPAGCNSTRFQCVLGNAAVLDRETGLVWALSAGTTSELWNLAQRDCMDETTGAHMGWRLPSLPELRSLLDGVSLPAGNPFVNGVSTFWTSTTVSDATTQAYVVNVANPAATFTAVKTADLRRAWCVRGGSGYDAY